MSKRKTNSGGPKKRTGEKNGPTPTQMQSNRFSSSAGSIGAQYNVPGPSRGPHYFQQPINMVYPPPRYGAGYFSHMNSANQYFSGQEHVTPGFYPQWGSVPGSENTLASILALQQSTMLSTMQENLLRGSLLQAASSTANANVVNAGESSMNSGVSQRTEAPKKTEVNVKKFQKEMHKMLDKMMVKHGVINKNPGRGGRGGRGNRGDRGGRGRGFNGWRGGRGGGQGLSI
ncbi:nucleolin-like [Leptopilina boulardi]|uniref:nucleolin-like n=1 Tax=Leptopilina boulardi TaxID=63433 RepID=UPI0021F5D324|nr:nucleolin-like [Leptopilina boulardi]